MTSDEWTYYRPIREGVRPEGVHEADPGFIVQYRGDPGMRWRRSTTLGWLPSVEYRYRVDRTAYRCGGKKCGIGVCADCYPKLAEQQLPLPVELPENPKAIYGRAKPSLGLFPSAALIECAGVFQSGADKYGLANWRKDAVESMTYVHAALRHIFKWVDGQNPTHIGKR